MASCFNCSSTRKRTCRRVTRFVFGLPPPRIAGFLALAAVFFRGVAVVDRVLLGGAGGTGRASGAVTRFGLGRPTPRVAGLVRAVIVAVGGIAVAERVLRRGDSAAGIGCAGGAAAGAARAGGAGGRCWTSCVARMGVLLRVLRWWTRLAVRSVAGWVGSAVVPVAPTLGAPWVSTLSGPCWFALGVLWFFGLTKAPENSKKLSYPETMAARCVRLFISPCCMPLLGRSRYDSDSGVSTQIWHAADTQISDRSWNFVMIDSKIKIYIKF